MFGAVGQFAPQGLGQQLQQRNLGLDQSCLSGAPQVCEAFRVLGLGFRVYGVGFKKFGEGLAMPFHLHSGLAQLVGLLEETGDAQAKILVG